MLEPVYRLAPDLIRSGRVNRPPGDTAASREVRMTDFRLLRRGGFYHAVARYGPDLWTPFTYAGLHATERALRRKEQHRFWGVDCYFYQEDRYLRIGNRLFYEFSVFQSTQKSTVLMGRRFGCDRSRIGTAHIATLHPRRPLEASLPCRRGRRRPAA